MKSLFLIVAFICAVLPSSFGAQSVPYQQLNTKQFVNELYPAVTLRLNPNQFDTNSTSITITNISELFSSAVTTNYFLVGGSGVSVTTTVLGTNVTFTLDSTSLNSLWTNVFEFGQHDYYPSQAEDQLQATNIVALASMNVDGVFRIGPTGFTNLVAGPNNVDLTGIGYLQVISSDSTAQLRLGGGPGPTSFLLVSFLGDPSATFTLKNGDAVWDTPSLFIQLRGGDWTPQLSGETMLLFQNGEGWAELERFGGSTNVLTENLWVVTNGVLQAVTQTNQTELWAPSGKPVVIIDPAANNSVFINATFPNVNFETGGRTATIGYTTGAFDLSLPTGTSDQVLFGSTNLFKLDYVGGYGSITWGPGTTNSMARVGSDIVVTNSSTDPKFILLNGSANGVELEAQSLTGFLSAAGSSTTVGLRAGSSQVILSSGVLEPVVDVHESLGNEQQSWSSIWSTNLTIRGFKDATGTNYSRLVVSHTGTNGPIVFASQAAGSAGSPRSFDFIGSDFRIAGVPEGVAVGGPLPVMPNTSDCYGTNIFFPNVATGTTTLFTVPANMRFQVMRIGLNATTNGTSCYTADTTNSAVFQLVAATTVNTNGTTLSVNNYVFEQGEAITLVTSGALDHAILCGVVFTNTMPLRSYSVNNPSSGNNTVYTVPAGKHPVGPSGSFNGGYFNNSGVTRTVSWYFVPSGSAADATTRNSTSSVLDAAAGGVSFQHMLMAPGDSIVINTDANTTRQHAFITVIETP